MTSDPFDSNFRDMVQNGCPIPGASDHLHFSVHCQKIQEKCTKQRKRYRPNHNEIERKRRMTQMQSIHALKNSIPSLQSNKSSIIVIVSKAKEYIEYLTQRVQALESLALSYDKNALVSLDSAPNIIQGFHPITDTLDDKSTFRDGSILSQSTQDTIFYSNLPLSSSNFQENSISNEQAVVSSDSDIHAPISLPLNETYRQDIKTRPPSLKFPLRDTYPNSYFPSRVVPAPSTLTDISPTMTSSENLTCMNAIKPPHSLLPPRRFSYSDKPPFPFTPESPVPLHYPVSFAPTSTCNHHPVPQNASCIMQLPNLPPPQPSPTTHHMSHFPAHFVRSPTAPMCSPLSPFSATVFSPTQPSHLSTEIPISNSKNTDSLKEGFVQFFPPSFSSSFQPLNLAHSHYSSGPNPSQHSLPPNSAPSPSSGSNPVLLMKSPLSRYNDHEMSIKEFSALQSNSNSNINHVNLRYYTSGDS